MTFATEAGPPPIAREFVPLSSPAIQPSGQRVFERLHALVRRGYVPEIGASERTGVVVLRHIGRAPDLILHGDGTVQGFDGRRPWYKRHIEPPAPIAPEGDAEHLRFLLFLETVPKGSLWDRTRKWRKKYLYFPAALILIWGVCLTLTATFIEL